MKKQDLHLKSVELRLHIITWCHSKRCLPGRTAPPTPSDATTSAPLATPMALAMIVEICLPFRDDTVL